MKKISSILIQFLFFFFFIQLQAQTQIGADINGEASGDLFGSAVSFSSDGTVVAIGANGNNGNGTDSGHVRIYKNVNDVWTQVGSDINGEAGFDQSGDSVSLSSDGTIVAIGANGNNGNGTDSGHVRIYKNVNDVWTQVGSDINGEAIDDESGYAVSLSSDGTIVAIGAPRNDDNGSGSGHVRIYKNVNDVWTQIGSDINGEAAGDRSGWSVSLSSDGTIVAIGALYNDGGGSNAGHVRIYKNVNDVWTQIGSDIDGEAGLDNSGWSVSLSSDGTIVAIGASDNDGGGSDSGHVRIYKNVNDVWTQIGDDIDGETAGDNSGWSVSLSSDGTIVAIGASDNDGGGSDSGHVRIYKNVNDVWTQLGSDIDGEAAGDNSGRAISLSSDGTIIAIGADLNTGNGFNSGHVRVYSIAGLVKLQNQIGSNINGEASNDESGRAVSFSSDGTIVAIGATQNDGNGSNSGHVRIYKNVNSVWTQVGSDINGEAIDDESGYAVSLNSDGTIVAISALFNDDGGSDAGHVSIYKNVNDVWTQVGSDINGEAADDKSGRAISLSSDGTIVAIGASDNDGNGTDSGHVRIYKNVNDVWIQIGADINGETAGDDFGRAVNLSSDGTIVAIGANLNDGGGSDAGHVRIYKNVNDVWTQVGSDIDGETAGDHSGIAVSLSSDGTVVAIGGRYNDGGGSDAGHIRIYKNVNDVWTQVGTDIDGEAVDDQSGWSVSLSADGSLVAIGSRLNDGNGTSSGHVRIYKNINDVWMQIGDDIDGAATFNQFGYAVSLSADGDLVAISAWSNDDNGTDSGHVKIYTTGYYIWQGTTNRTWRDNSNWKQGFIPAPNAFVSIPSGSNNYPTVRSTISVNTIEIQSGVSFRSSSNVIVNGNIKYIRSLPTSNWYLIASPVVGQDINTFVAATEGGLQTGTQSNNIGLGLSYNTVSNTWTFLQSGASGTGNFTNGQGYTINLENASGEISFTGTMLTDDLTPITLTTTGDGYNLIGNPYPSFINGGAILRNNTSSLDAETLWVWNASNEVYDAKISGLNFKIAPTQAFFVKSDGASGTLAINEGNQSHQSTDTFQKQSNNTEVKLFLSTTNYNRDATIYYLDSATTGYDNGYDGELFGGSSHNLAIYSELVEGSVGKKYQIQSVPKTNMEEIVIPLGIIGKKNDEITITAKAINIPEGLNLYLEDKINNSFTELENEDSKFTITLNEDVADIGRFFLHTKAEILSTTTSDLNSVNIFYSPNTKELHINGFLETEPATIQVYNVLGKEVFSKSFISKPNNTLMLPKLNKGVYVVLFNNTKGKASKKIVIE